MIPVSDLAETEPVLVRLALLQLKSNDEMSDLLGPGFCDQRLHLPQFRQQLIWVRSAESVCVCVGVDRGVGGTAIT